MPAMRLLGRLGRRPRDPRKDGAGPNTKIGYLTETDLFRGLDDAENRKALHARLDFSLDGLPDPWFEFDKAKIDARQFEPLSL